MSSETIGQVITFYSYKGGTGRSMALSNVACLLARRQADARGVLMMDWDLEAPGLHRFFRGLLTCCFSEAGDRAFNEHLGLIDLFLELDAKTSSSERAGERVTEGLASELVSEPVLERFILKTDIPSLHLIKAGRFDEKYSMHVNTFQWEAFYQRSPWLIRSFAERLAERYRYVLIDSRTGVTDTSGICTMLMPERLVAVFTPNRQSVMGVLELIRRATNYRRQSDDLRPLVVFPLPSRIEAAEPQLREDWRKGNQGSEIIGYQSQFEELFKEVYDLPECNLEAYFNEVQIQHIPRYAYGEEIAVLIERGGDRLSLARSYESFTERLVTLTSPWESREEEDVEGRRVVQRDREHLPQAKKQRHIALATLEPEMILILAGVFLMGSDSQKDIDATSDEKPQHTLYLPDYYLAKTPITNAQYAAFVQATGANQPVHWADGNPPKGMEDHPMVNVRWLDAMAYCRWLSEVTDKSYSLPSEAEWEKGARGTDGRIYPWGNEWDAMRYNSGANGEQDTTPVGAYLQGASPYGVLDMTGNVWEWTRGLWSPYPYDPDDGRENLNGHPTKNRVLRGGVFLDIPRCVRCAYRNRSVPYSWYENVGFRVVLYR
jgi:formylglycine-generating enzyme required for sulfatase activity/cellulose biosynthesis protein BcsQ